MAGHVYAVASGKGGVGKTTTVLNLGVVLAQAGREVVVVDADLAMSNLGDVLDVDTAANPGIHGVLADEATVREAIVEGPDGLAVLPGNADLDAFADADPTGLQHVLRILAAAYEVVLVDTAAGVQRSNFVGFRESDAVLVVAEPDGVAVADANRTIHLAAKADCPTLGTAVTCADPEDPPPVVEALAVAPAAVIPDHRTDRVAAARRPDGEPAAAYRELATALPAVEALGGTTTEADGRREHEETVAS